MNYLPFAGGWFYGAATATEMASFYSSWGLLDIAGTEGIISGGGAGITRLQVGLRMR